MDAFAVSQDGEQLVTGHDNIARIWQTATALSAGPEFFHGASVKSAAFHPNGKRFVTGSGDGKVQVWDVKSGKPVGVPMLHEDPVTFVAYSPDGEEILTLASGIAHTWDADTCRSTGEPLGDRGSVTITAFSPNGTFVLTGGAWQLLSSDGGFARIWHTHKEIPIAELNHDLTGSFGFNVAFDAKGDRILTGAIDGTLRLWHGMTGEPISGPMKHEYSIGSIALSADGKRAWAGGTFEGENKARLWDCEKGIPIGAEMEVGRDDAFREAQFNADGTRLLIKSGTSAQLWNCMSAAPIGNPIEFHMHICFSEDGEYVISDPSVNDSGQWSWRQTRKGAELSWGAIKYDATSGARLGSASPSEERLLMIRESMDRQRNDRVAINGHIAHLNEPAAHQLLGVPMRHQDVDWAALSPNGERVVTASNNCIARLWDVRSTPHPSQKIAWYELLLGRVTHRSVATDKSLGEHFANISKEDVDERWAALRNDESWLSAMRQYEPANRTPFQTLESRRLRDAAVLALRAKCRLSIEGAEAAIQEGMQISVDGPASSFSLLFLGELRILAGKPDEAVTLIKNAIASGGVDPWYQKSLGWALWSSGQQTSAQEAFSVALGSTRIESADLDRLVAAYYLDRIDMDEFVRLATAKGAQGEAFARFYIGQRLWWRGEKPLAQKQFEKALAAAKRFKATGVVINWAGAMLETNDRNRHP
jgi:WD40 repeat protein